MATSTTSPVANVLESDSQQAMDLNLDLSEQGQSRDRRNSEPALPLLELPSAVRGGSNERQSMSAVVANDGGSALSPRPRTPDVEQQSSGTDVNQTTIFGEKVWHHIRSLFPSNGDHEESALERSKREADEEYDKRKQKQNDEYVEGRPRLANFQSSDDDVAMFRAFHQLNTRALIYLQYELINLEEALFAQDHQALREGQAQGRRVVINDNDNEGEHNMLPNIITKLRAYNGLLLEFAEIRGLGRAKAKHHRNLFYWVWNYLPSYSKFYHLDDFVNVAGIQIDFFESLTQGYFYNFPKWWPVVRLLSSVKVRRLTDEQKYFTSKEDDAKNTNPFVAYASKSRIAAFTKLIPVSLAVGILLAPVFLLFLVPMTRGIMALVLSIFLFVFAVATTFTTNAKIHEIFIGTSTYGAVLIVFLGNLTGRAT